MRILVNFNFRPEVLQETKVESKLHTFPLKLLLWSCFYRGVVMYVMMIGFLPFTTPYTDHYKRIKLVQMMNKGLSSDHHITQMQILTQGKLTDTWTYIHIHKLKHIYTYKHIHACAHTHTIHSSVS